MRILERQMLTFRMRVNARWCITGCMFSANISAYTVFILTTKNCWLAASFKKSVEASAEIGFRGWGFAREFCLLLRERFSLGSSFSGAMLLAKECFLQKMIFWQKIVCFLFVRNYIFKSKRLYGFSWKGWGKMKM